MISGSSRPFRLLGAPLLADRDFIDRNRIGEPAVAIVNESFAAASWPGESPLGRRVRQAIGNQPGEWRTIVGVVENVMKAMC